MGRPSGHYGEAIAYTAIDIGGTPRPTWRAFGFTSAGREPALITGILDMRADFASRIHKCMAHTHLCSGISRSIRALGSGPKLTQLEASSCRRLRRVAIVCELLRFGYGQSLSSGRPLLGQVTKARCRASSSLALSDVTLDRGTEDPGLDRQRLVSFGWLMGRVGSSRSLRKQVRNETLRDKG